eukprot:12091-Heterococcus_DN1.PRE.10
MNRIWSYLFTTADPAVQKGFVELAPVESDHGKESPLAGLGYGLPISRSYARSECCSRAKSALLLRSRTNCGSWCSSALVAAAAACVKMSFTNTRAD